MVGLRKMLSDFFTVYYDLKEAKVFYACTFDIIIMYAFRYLFLFRVNYMATQKRSKLGIYSELSWSVRHE